MSIRALALELYRAQQKVSRLEKERDEAAPLEYDHLDNELQAAQAELKQLRRMLEGAKVESPFTSRSAGKRGR